MAVPVEVVASMVAEVALLEVFLAVFLALAVALLVVAADWVVATARAVVALLGLAILDEAAGLEAGEVVMGVVRVSRTVLG